MTAKIYTGIGSRETPSYVLDRIRHVAGELGRRGWTLRSGGAAGADDAFEAGHGTASTEIYLPHQNFNGRMSSFGKPTAAAHVMAQSQIPYWANIRPFVKDLLARNMHQVLGPTLNVPSAMVLCWTPGGKMQGGTRYALALAQDHGVPIFNFAHYDSNDVFTPLIRWMHDCGIEL